MNNQVRGMQQANRNVQQGNNMLQTAEGGLNEISNILGRMRELAVQSASDGVNADDRASIDLEFQQLKAEITRIADGTEYNNTKLLDDNLNSSYDSNATRAAVYAVSGDSAQAGTYTVTASGADLTLTTSDGRSQTVTVTNDSGATSSSLTTSAGGTGNTVSFGSLGVTLTSASAGSLDLSSMAATTGGVGTISVTGGATIQVGANNVALEDRLRFSIGDHRADESTGLNLSSTNLTALGDAQSAINELDTAIAKVNDSRGNIGAMQNRFEFTSSNLMNSIQNNSASMSTIRDADFAVEAADLARNQILTQSGTAMLAQANGLSQNVLSLIR
jgi:flagellin